MVISLIAAAEAILLSASHAKRGQRRSAIKAPGVAGLMAIVADSFQTQIGLVMLIGLAAKNAILIVEFAKVEVEKAETWWRQCSQQRVYGYARS